MKKFFKNKIVKRSLIALVIILIGGGIYYFKDSILGLFGNERDYSHTLIPVKQSDNGDFGFVNFDGELIVDFDLDLDSGETVGYMYNNIASYTDNESGNIVYVDNELNETTTKYAQSLYFHDGMALVVEDFGPLVYINSNFEKVLSLPYKEAGYFSEGLTKFKDNNGKWGFINKEGDIVIEADYSSVSSFIDGYSIVRKEDDGYKEIGVIDNTGEEIIDISDKYISLWFSDGGEFRFWREDEAGFIDEEGKEFIEEDWTQITPFNDGYASFGEKIDEDKWESEWGLIDEDGEVIIKPKEETPIYMNNGLYVFKDDQEFGYKNIDGDKVIKAKYEVALPFYGKGAFVKKGNHWDYIDKNGEKIKKKDNDIKHLNYDANQNYYLGIFNTPFDLNKTLISRVLNIDSMLAEVFPSLSYDIFGVNKDSDVMDVIRYMKDQSHFISDNTYNNISEDTLLNKININSYISSSALFNSNRFVIDENFSYIITYYFDEDIVEYKTERRCNNYHSYSCDHYKYSYSYGGVSRHNDYMREYTIYGKPYNKNYDANLISIYTKIELSGTAIGMEEKIIEEIENHLLDYNYNVIDNDYTKDNHNIQVSSYEDHITITTTFN